MTAGSVYLAASSHAATLAELATRARASIGRSTLRVAITSAPSGGAMGARSSSFVESIFPGARVTRFTVDGEPGAMSPRDARAIVDDADVVFVGGGDPVHGARLLAAAGADAWLRDARARGAACMGISAGAMVLCAWWASWPDDPPPGAPHDGGELVPCTRVVPDLVVDCHAEADGWAELALVKAMLIERLGDARTLPRLVGLPTGSGVVVAPDGALDFLCGEPFRP